MSGYQLLPALPIHAEAFSVLSRSVAYSPQTADPAQGYLVFQGTPGQYAARLATSPESIIVFDESGTPAAFLLADRKPSVLIIDQICVSPTARGAGLAQRMLDALVTAARPVTVAAAIMHSPVRNARSIRFFCQKNGFSLCRSYWEESFEWGLYERVY